MEQTKYEQKVRERAEELAKIILGGSYIMLSEGARDTAVNGCSGYARLSLQREAEAYRKGWEQCRKNSALPPNDYGLSDKLHSLGLVP